MRSDSEKSRPREISVVAFSSSMTAWMRQTEGQSLFIVAITGWGQDDDRRKTHEAGFDAHVVKPVAPDALLHLVEHAPGGKMH